MTYRIHRVQPWVGNQIILWLEDEHTKETGPDGPDGSQWCVRVTVDEARKLIPDIMNAYAVVMQNIAMELACGGCRTCKNERTINGSPCPVCIPRGEKKLRSVVHLKPKDMP